VKKPVLIVALLLGVATAAAAQFGRPFQGFGPRGYPAKFATAENFGRGFNFCRGVYTSGRREAGGQGWSTDYPDAEQNFSIRLGELTKVRVARDGYGEADHVVVRLTDQLVYQCPYLHMEDVGTASFTDEEVAALRAYLLKGGFVWVDDFWGTYAWNNWVSQLARVLPPVDYPVQDIAPDHPVLKAMFDVKEIPQIPSIQFWRTSGGGISERGSDSAVPHMRAVSDKQGNVMVLMTHNTDISDAWEREGEDPRFFYSFSPDGYAVGINVILYAMTH
jgi:hypothetical protein